jgi:ketosteroid isomerase-like protein
MSLENVELVLAAFETYNRHGMRTTAAKYYHPAVEWQMSPSWAIVLADKTVWRGREEVIAAYDEVESTLGRMFADVFDVVDAGDEVLVGFRATGEGIASGAPVADRLWFACRVKDGLVDRVRMFESRPEALEAVGLRE